MPVQKYACPNDVATCDADSGSRHMLFAGTQLLQAGSEKGDEVLAVVSATGLRFIFINSDDQGLLGQKIIYCAFLLYT